jgi:hypothetical protein
MKQYCEETMNGIIHQWLNVDVMKSALQIADENNIPIEWVWMAYAQYKSNKKTV